MQPNLNFRNALLANLAPIVFVALTACGIHENKGSTGSSADIATKVSYAQVNAAVFQVSCKGCHMNGAARGGVSLDTYAEVFANLGAVKSAVFSGVPSSMPPNGMAADQKLLLQTWIDQGAVENPAANASPTVAPVASATPVPAPLLPIATPAPGALVPTYQQNVREIFAAKCLQCHSTGGRAADYPLDNYAAMMATSGLVVAGNPVSSDLINAIRTNSMPPKRANLPAVTADEFVTIQNWIWDGASEGTVTPVSAPTATPVPSVSPSPAPVVPALPLTPTYQSIRDNIFAPKCLLCHVAGGKAADIPLDTLAGVMGANVIKAGDAANSDLVNAIASGSMPPKRANLPAVTADELAVIKLWITNGANP